MYHSASEGGIFEKSWNFRLLKLFSRVEKNIDKHPV